MTTSDKSKGEALPQVNDRFRLLFESVADALFLHDLEGRFVEVNQAACDSLGYTREELLRLPFPTIVKDGDPEALGDLWARVLQGKKLTIQGFHQRRDGVTFPVEVHLSPFAYEGRPHILASARDITERREAEKAIQDGSEKYRRLQANIPGMVYVFALHPDGSYSFPYANAASRELFDVAPEDLMRNGALLTELIHPDDRERRDEAIRRSAATLQPFKEELRHIVNGKVRWYDCMSRPEPQPNGDILWDGIMLEITGRKQAEAALAESEQRFSTFMAHLPAAVFIKDQTGRLLFANRYLRETFGWEDCLGKTTTKLLPREMAERMIEDDQRVLTAGPMLIHERITDVQGLERFFDTYKFPIAAEGAPSLLGGIAVDVTDRHRAEEALNKAKLFTEAILDSLPGTFFLLDSQGQLMRSNKSGLAISGFSPEEMSQMHALESIAEEDRPAGRQALAEVFEKGETSIEAQLLTKDSRKIPFLFTARLFIIDGQPFILGTGVDITTRKQMEAALRESQGLYHDLVETAQDLIWQCDSEGRYTYLNPAWEEVFGYKIEEMLGKRFSDFQPQEYAARDLQEFNRLLEGNIVKGLETIHLAKDGRELHLVFNAKVARDKDGNAYGSRGTAYNITERKLAEEALRESEERYRSLFQNNHAVMFLIDPETGYFMDANPAACAYYGFPKEELLAKKITDLNMLPQEQVFRAMHSAQEEKRKFFEFRHHLASGEVRDVEVFSGPIRIKGQELLYSIVHDVTARKETEKALLESEARFRQVVESSPLPIGLANEAGMIEYLNLKFVETFGYTLEDVPQMVDWYRLAYPDPAYRQQVVSRWQEGLEKTTLGSSTTEAIEVEITCKDGSKRIMEIFGAPMGNKTLAVFNDLTERKRMEEAMEKRLVALSRPLGDMAEVEFQDLFNLEEIQRLSDLFAKSTGVAGLITAPDGKPITKPSNFTRFCGCFIRQTELGRRRCSESDSQLGRHNPDGPTIQHCLSAGLWGAGASITVGGKHIGNWLIGQVRDESVSEESIRNYARALGLDEEEFIAAFREVPIMSKDQFEQVAQALFIFANQLSTMAYNNIQQARFITERKRAEVALRDSEERLRLALQAANQGLYDLNIQTGEAKVSPEYATMLGYDPTEFQETNARWIERLHPDDREQVAATYQAYIRGDIPIYEVEFRQRTQSGDWKWILSLGKVVAWDEDGKPLRMLGTHTDITERKKAEEALRESEKRLREVQEMARLGFWYWNVKTGDVTWSDEVYNIFQLDPKEFTPHIDSIMELSPWPEDHERDKELIRKAMESHEKGAFEQRFLLPDKSIGYYYSTFQGKYDDGGNLIFIVGTVLDITARKRAEEERAKLEAQMQEVQKLESLGILAGGIAHDFNNLLMAILGNADLALLSLSPASPARPNMEEITRASMRAADLCRQMLAYSGKGRFVMGCYDLSEIVREMAQMLKVSVSKKAALRYFFAADLPAVEVDATQIRQVIMNLITNASEALGDQSGFISVSTGVMDCDRAYLAESYLDDKLPEGKYVYLEVSDTGSGIDEETRRRMFDPFFTTKFTGRGLGLAAVLGIVRGHQGAIKIYSEVGQGTTFKVLLPAREWALGGREQSAAPSVKPIPGGRTILLVDDDSEVRDVGSQMLKRLGFKVLTAAHGQEGLKVFQEYGSEIDCVILDLTMPEMGGEELFRELRRLRSDVRVILSSGYNEQEVTQRFASKGLAGFIQKPYRVANLQEILYRVLE